MDKVLFSNRLKAERKKKFRSQEAFAEEYDRKYNWNENTKEKTILATLKNYENPNKDIIPSLEIVDRMCGILGCDVDYLLGRIDYKTHDNKEIASKLSISEKSVEALKELSSIYDVLEFSEKYPDINPDFATQPTWSLNELLCSEWLIPFLGALYNCLTVNWLPTSTEKLLNSQENEFQYDERLGSSLISRMDEIWRKEKMSKINKAKANEKTLSIFNVQLVASKIGEAFAASSAQNLKAHNDLIERTIRGRRGGNGI